ncbi:MAG TPA: ATP-binding protein [Sulfurospirillum arcachonense]|nr:ATP-binding protein [Sulfurospirillum arcachonense]
MEILENLYDIKHKNNHYHERKLSINSKKTLINGVKKSGKTSLIIDYLSNFIQDEILYIDLKDTRVDTKVIAKNLKNFLVNKPIKILVIENFDNSFELPKVEEIILTCFERIEGFETLTLYPLDFEEFISFDARHSNIEHIFQIYANTGSYPQVILNSSNSVHWSMQEMLHVMISDNTEFEIFKKFSEAQSSKISLFQIYNQLKSTIKISKDSLYKKVKKLEEEKMLFLVEKYGSPKSSKKLFLIDFALKNALTFKKEFLKRFENMVFLELMKKGYKIYYSDFIDLYIPKKNYGVLCIPFLPQEMIKLRLQKILVHVKELGIKKIDIVTVGNEGEFWLKNTKCSILPFWDWALQD